MIEQQQNIPLELPETWYLTDIDMCAQFYKEVPEEHILFAKKLKTIARRQDNDDVLFQLEDEEFGFAVVHLTWTTTRNIYHQFPITNLFRDWNDVFTNRILKDSHDYK